MDVFDENINVPTQPAQPAEKSNSVARFFRDFLETLLLALVLFYGINALSARVRVDGYSMQPTLKNGQYVLVNRIVYQFTEPKRGDIVVFHSPIDAAGLDLIKRVIGVPGDLIEITNGRVSINGKVLQEPYVAAAPSYTGTWKVSAGHLFVLGDNRNDSSDSHSWGLLPQENVVGKAILIYWPPPDWDTIEHASVSAKLP